jgi:hypothetical protein
VLALRAAADARHHVVISGGAPARAVLSARRRFLTATSPVCGPHDPVCLHPGPPRLVQEEVSTRLTVGAGGRFAWHLGPSTRPLEARAGRVETWTLACSIAGVVVASRPLAAGPGAHVVMDPCAPWPLPDADGLGSLPPSRALPQLRAPAVVGRRDALRVAVRCPQACRAEVVVQDGADQVLARAPVTLPAARWGALEVRPERATWRAGDGPGRATRPWRAGWRGAPRGVAAALVNLLRVSLLDGGTRVVRTVAARG